MESDCYWIFREIYPLLKSIDGGMLEERVFDIVRRREKYARNVENISTSF